MPYKIPRKWMIQRILIIKLSVVVGFLSVISWIPTIQFHTKSTVVNLYKCEWVSGVTSWFILLFLAIFLLTSTFYSCFSAITQKSMNLIIYNLRNYFLFVNCKSTTLLNSIANISPLTWSPKTTFWKNCPYFKGWKATPGHAI